MIFGNKRCEAAVKNSRELLMALRNERRPECAHQLTGETKGWKIASALDCIVVLFVTNGFTPVRLAFCLAGKLRVNRPRMILCTLPSMVVL